MISSDPKMFVPPWYLFNGHLETIFPVLFRKVTLLPDVRHRINTPDKDFIDIDFYDLGRKKTAILCHGLEGNSEKPYIKGMIKTLISEGFNCIAWNYRGCSGIPNNHPYSYHSGATDDLRLILEVISERYADTALYLIGFSLGGNLILKLLGEESNHSMINKAVAISAPLDLLGSCRKISKPSNILYSRRFLHSLKKKVRIKSRSFPEYINTEGLDKINTLELFDDKYTAPLHGFRNAFDYYEKCSSIHYLHRIRVHTLIINAQNDPFLSEDCFPKNVNKEYITCDYPEFGGHLGFKMSGGPKDYYHELKTAKFLTE